MENMVMTTVPIAPSQSSVHMKGQEQFSTLLICLSSRLSFLLVTVLSVLYQSIVLFPLAFSRRNITGSCALTSMLEYFHSTVD